MTGDGGGRVRIKICGITNPGDAALALEHGVDALGFNFYRASKRYIDMAAAEAWLRDLPSTIERIAILVDPSPAQALELAALPFIDTLQLHGNESPEFCAGLAARGVSVIKAFPISEQFSLGTIDAYRMKRVLLDSASVGYGGSGRTFPWATAAALAKERPELQVILAGGLDPDNVGRAIREVRPFGVDVTTGVEARPGVKDPARLAAFVRAARETLP